MALVLASSLPCIIFRVVTTKLSLWTIDRVVIVVALAGFFIRMGNLMNSEIFGHITTLPWGFQFVRYYDPALNADPRHPTQIYEGLIYLFTFFLLYRLYMKGLAAKREGMLFGLFLIFVFGSRIFVEFLKEPQVDFEASMMLNMGQWLSIPFVIGGIYLLWKSLQKQPIDLGRKRSFTQGPKGKKTKKHKVIAYKRNFVFPKVSQWPALANLPK
jgi:phosphatidylglycerol---prolipoprotein diacylglyceryl transferase